MYSTLKVLLLLAEFPFWRAARHLSYSAQFGIEEGLHKNRVNCVTVTSLCLPKAMEIYQRQRFDQVWVVGRPDLFHEESLERLVALAPVRICLLPESLEYSSEECRVSPTLRNRKHVVQQRLKYMTHTVACDEKDVDELNSRGVTLASWWPQAVPERFIFEDVAAPVRNCAVFYGASYGRRREWMRLPELRRVLAHPNSPERGTLYPLSFGRLHLPLLRPLRFVLPMKEQSLAVYLSRLRHIRERCFRSWLSALQTGPAVVNLPHFVKTYAGRVVEGMAAGRPVISWEIPGRPRNKALFEDEQEILLYAETDPRQLADQIRRILGDESLSRRIVLNARKKIRRFHTSEIRVRQILDWSTDGRPPCYS